MNASGLGHDRVLVEGKPCPDLSDGSPIILPYADNLNVAGTSAEKVQEVKDKVVDRLRQLGFRVHEEIDAQHTCQSLGFSPTAECFGVFSHSKGFGADRSSSKTHSPKVPRFQVKVPK